MEGRSKNWGQGRRSALNIQRTGAENVAPPCPNAEAQGGHKAGHSDEPEASTQWRTLPPIPMGHRWGQGQARGWASTPTGSSLRTDLWPRERTAGWAGEGRVQGEAGIRWDSRLQLEAGGELW